MHFKEKENEKNLGIALFYFTDLNCLGLHDVWAWSGYNPS